MSAGRRVLVIALSGSIYQLKIQLMLAAALRIGGWQPVAMLGPRRSTLPERYCRAFGVSEIVHYDRIPLSERDTDECLRVASRLMSGPLSFQAVKDWTFRDAWIGPQVLSSVSRANMMGAPDPSDPAIQSQLAALLPPTLESVIRAERMLAEIEPALGIAVEANYAINGAMVDVAVHRGASVIQVTQPWRDDALMCKRLTPATRRTHPSSASMESLEILSQRPWSDEEDRELKREFENRYGGRWFLQNLNQPHTQSQGRHEIVDRFTLDADKKISVVFSHLLWDANLFYGHDLFDDYGDWFVQTVRGATENPRVNWLVKLHPANLWKRAREGVTGEYSELELIRTYIGELPGHVRLVFPETDLSTLSVFEHADYGVTVRGTTGMEMACFGKTVLTAGTGRYSGLGFTVDSGTRDEYLDRLAHIETLPPLTREQTILARRHAHAVFIMRPWRMKSFRSHFSYERNGAHPLDQNLHPTVTSLDELQRNGDLDRWARWAGDSSRLDYLEHEDVQI